jgi:hypothetical protein
MSAQSKQSIVWTIVLIGLGLAAIYAGTRLLVILIPAALLVWYGVAQPLVYSDRDWPLRDNRKQERLSRS